MTAARCPLDPRLDRCADGFCPTCDTDAPEDTNPAAAAKAILLGQAILGADELDRLPAREPLIDGILMRSSSVVVYGPPASLKSFVALDMAACVASGAWWQGHRVKEAQTVLYMAAEGSFGLHARVDAWKKHNNVCRLPTLHFLPVAVDLMNNINVEAMAIVVENFQPAFIVIDTKSRSMPGANENAPEVMSRFVANVDEMRIGATTLIVDHTPREGGHLRGHSALDGAVDTLIECVRTGAIVTLRCTKQKDAEEFEPIRLAAVKTPITLGTEPHESLAIDCHLGMAVTDELADIERTIAEALWQSSGSDGLSATTLLAITGIAERTFYRALKSLVSKGVARNVGTDHRPRYTATQVMA